jgi:hypothetical protein
MLIPTIILDNFFKYPEKIIEFSKTLQYEECTDGAWPGKRSKNLCEISQELFNKINLQMLSLIYPLKNHSISFEACTQFQKISSIYRQGGWIHADDGMFTFIVYLSNHKECGTSIYEPKNTISGIIHHDKKRNNYLNKKFDDDTFLLENNSQFEETIKIKSRYNRIIGFDSSQIHGAQNFFENGLEEDRLTLISFISNIQGNITFSGVENSRKY